MPLTTTTTITLFADCNNTYDISNSNNISNKYYCIKININYNINNTNDININNNNNYDNNNYCYFIFILRNELKLNENYLLKMN